MTIQRPAYLSSPIDPFQLDRLAEELNIRELNPSDGLDSYELLTIQPLSHENAFLAEPEFRLEEFLLSRSYTSLPDLRLELRDYLAQLKEELVKLINDDYEAFISLSTDLKDEGRRLTRLRFPLNEIKSKVLQSRKDLQVIQVAIQEKLNTRAKLREEKILLRLLLSLSESITRLETLLLISSPEAVTSQPFGGSSIILSEYVGRVSDEPANDRSRGGRAKHLGRVAAEYVQLVYHASKAREEKCRFIEEVQWRIDRIQSTLSTDLDHIFATTLTALTDGKVTDVEKHQLFSDLVECLKTYDALRLWRDAEDVLRKEIVRKFVKKTIYPGALVTSHSPILPHTPFLSPKTASTPLLPRTPYTPFPALMHLRQGAMGRLGSITAPFHFHILEQSDEPLAKLYVQILRFVERDLARIVETAELISKGSIAFTRTGNESGPLPLPECTDSGFQIMANAVWQELGRALMDDLGNMIFDSGDPKEFRKNHELSQSFVHSLEHYATSARSVEAMRAHPVRVAFEQRWQLPVYFQMRWKEIVGTLQASLAIEVVEPVFTKDKYAFVSSQANAVWVAVTACWSAEIFIQALCHHFWKLTLQILSRYKAWLALFSAKTEDIAKASPSTSVEKVSLAISQNRSVPPNESSTTENTMADEITLRQNVALIADIRTMRTNVLRIWREEISMMLPETPSELEGHDSKALGALDHTLSSLTSYISPLSMEIVSILTKRCCDGLVPVRSIPSQFRAMSDKRAPTQPSYFVTSILRPVKAFFGVGGGDGPGVFLGEGDIKSYATDVFENVAQRYSYYLTTMKKTEESLRRLRKGKKITSFGPSNAIKEEDSKDEERIRSQMVLDVQAFGQEGRHLGVDIGRCESFQALKNVVSTLEGAAE